MSIRPSSHPAGGFTLVELMVSFAVLLLLLVMLVGAVDSIDRTWRYTTAKIEQFQESREAFETMTRRLSQATLNTYWDYLDKDKQPRSNANKATFIPKYYVRQSDLRFISGLELAGTTESAPPRPTHSVFFQAALGEAGDLVNYGNLGMALNTVGYYLEFNSDTSSRPSFIASPERYRCRLMELTEPLESNHSIFNYTSTSGYNGKGWFTDLLTSTHARVIAENVIALVLLPKLAPKEDATGTLLASNYSYDSTTTKSDASINSKNQLPPVIQVTLVAIDEASATRLASRYGTALPNFGLNDLFKTAADMQTDMQTLETKLKALKINYRIFSTDVAIPGAKWSREQTQ